MKACFGERTRRHEPGWMEHWKSQLIESQKKFRHGLLKCWGRNENVLISCQLQMSIEKKFKKGPMRTFWGKLLLKKAQNCKSGMIKAMITGSLEKTITREICSTWISFPSNLNAILYILFYNELGQCTHSPSSLRLHWLTIRILGLCHTF